MWAENCGVSALCLFSIKFGKRLKILKNQFGRIFVAPETKYGHMIFIAKIFFQQIVMFQTICLVIKCLENVFL